MPGILDLGQAVPRQNIRENVEEQYLEFYVVGYTQTINNVNVQNTHRSIFQDARTLLDDSKDKKVEPLEYLWPFGDKNTKIVSVTLARELNNPEDSNATLVYVSMPLNISQWIMGDNTTRVNGLLGWVPLSISQQIAANFTRFKTGWIKKTKMIMKGKSVICTTKVAIPWKAQYTDITLQNRLKHGWDDE